MSQSQISVLKDDLAKYTIEKIRASLNNNEREALMNHFVAVEAYEVTQLCKEACPNPDFSRGKIAGMREVMNFIILKK